MKQHYRYLLQFICTVIITTAPMHSYAKSNSILDRNNPFNELEWLFVKTLVDEGLERELSRTDSFFFKGYEENLAPPCNDIEVILDTNGTFTIDPTNIDPSKIGDSFTLSQSVFTCEDIDTAVTVTIFENGIASCIAIVTIVDRTPPVSPTLSAITVDCNGTLTAPTTTDACSGTLTGTTPDALTFVEGGSTTITWTFDDGNGNSTTADQVYSFDDTTDPVTPTLSTVTVDCNGTLTAPTTTDACAGTLTATTPDGLTFVEGGSTTITWTFDDGNGNSTTADQVYNFDDTTDPITPTLADVTDECSVSLVSPTTTDTCEGTITGTTTTIFPITTQGETSVTWTFDDGNGNSINVNQNVIIDDITLPVAPTLLDVTGECTATATAPTTTDNCGATITGTTSDPLTYTTQGTHVITWNFDDGNGQNINVDQNVIIDDITPPLVPTLLDVTGECTATATAPTTTDNCGAIISGTTFDPLTYSTQGTHVITWNFDDGNGQNINVDQNVIIDDITPPVLPTLLDVTGECTATATAPTTTDNCGATITGTTSDPLTYTTQGTHVITWNFDDGNGQNINVDQNVIIDDITPPVLPTLLDVTGECTATATAPTTTDNCGATITGTTSDPLTYTTQGTHVITWNFDDGNGQNINVNQNVIIDDITPPMAPTLLDVTGECTATATAPTTTDNCGATITGTTSDPLTYTTQGTHVITWNFDDGNGQNINVNQNVIIDDITPPAIPTLANLTGECTATATVPTTTDNCGTTIIGTTSDPLTYSAQGAYVITWNFDDGNGQTINVNQNVIIDDVTPPAIPTLANVTGECTATATVPTTTDNCGATIIGTTSDPLTYSAQGAYVITWNFDDGNGQNINVDQNVIIDDITPPAIPTLANLTGECTATATVPTTTDNCGAIISGTTFDPLTYSTQGTHVITWNFDDGNGQNINVDQNVIIDDITPPVVPTLLDVTGECTATATAPTTTDNCGATITGTTSDPLTYTTQGTHVITWNFNDGNGNSIDVDQEVIIADTTNPIPTVTKLPNLTGQCSVNVTVIPTATDGCSGTITATTTSPLTYNTQGTYTVVWTYNDGHGNTITQAQKVIVDDTIKPVPDVATLTNAIGQCSVTAVAPTATDTCSGTIIATTTNPLTYTTQGTYTIVWTYNDGNGNVIKQNQKVIVRDNIAPVPTLTNLPDVTEECSVVTLVQPTATDNCGGSVTVTSNATLPITVTGTTVVTWTFKDALGNTSTQKQNVILKDITAPSVLCKNIEVTLGATGSYTLTPEEVDGGSTDNCAVNSMSLDITTFTCSDLGENTVTLSVLDAAGNKSTCNAIVTVVDPAENSSVTIASNDTNNEICLGENLTFTATPVNGGSEQFYTWFINGVNEGTTTGNEFTPTTTPTGDYTIFVRMATDLSACDPKQSNTLSILVHPLPMVAVSSVICIDATTQKATPTTGGTWTSNNTSIATISNSGIITPVGSGTVTFTFTNTLTQCSATTTPVVIKALPVLSAPATLCVNETVILSPSSGGIWSSSNTGIATVNPNTGEITGVSHGAVSFTFTDASGCTSTSSSVEVRPIPIINSVTALPNILCSGEDSNLIVNVEGAGGAAATLVNYDFNSGNSYTNLNGQEATNITSSITSNGIPYNRNENGRTTFGGAFTQNTSAGKALSQNDDWRDGGWFIGGNPDDGDWLLNVGGSNLSTYKTFRIYFEAKIQERNAQNKRIRVDYRINSSGSWINLGTHQLPNTNTNWRAFSAPLPIAANNPNTLQFRLNVDDGSSRSFWSGTREPHVLIDNLQIQGEKSGDTFTYTWSADTGANGGLPTEAITPSLTNNNITVNPSVTTNYTVSVANAEGCSNTHNVLVNVYPVPKLTIGANYCPDIPNNNKVELEAMGSGFVSYEWNTGETTRTIFVDVAGSYQVIGTTANGCGVSAAIDVAQELVVNGDFSFAKPTVDGTLANNQSATLGFEYDADYTNPYNNGYRYFANPTIYQNRFTIATSSAAYYPGIFRDVADNTKDAAGQFLLVNGDELTLAAWRQTITVEPNTNYYFSAFGIDISDPGNWRLRPTALTFRINGTDVGTRLDLDKGDDWRRFYGMWNSGSNTIAVVEIRNIFGDLNGNNFGIDDVSFATLSTFIRLTSPPGADAQTVCQNTTIDQISYDIGGGLTAPTIEWKLNGSSLGVDNFPDGLSYIFNGLSYDINGTPTVPGDYTYEVKTTSACDVKNATGSLTVDAAPLVTIVAPPAAVCQSVGTIPLSATLSGSATTGTWSVSGTAISTTVTGKVATANYTIATPGAVTFTFTSNNPDGTCEAAVETVTYNITPYVIATAGPDQTTPNCDTTTVTLAANDGDGQWTSSPNTGYFSDATSHNSKFTGESGTTYTLTWTTTNTGVCTENTFDSTTIIIPDCGTNLVFNGTKEYISFGDQYNLNGSFSIESWIKPSNVIGTKTIISKRNGLDLTTGYDLSLINSNLRFRFNGSQISANQNIKNTKWYHVAVTYDGANYTMFIDGFEVREATVGAAPLPNTNKALIGAMDKTNSAPINYFNGGIDGGIDEVRIWNTALTQSQIREMMNQEIKENNDNQNVMGEVIPMDISGPLKWENLIGYYRMISGSDGINVASGNVMDLSNLAIPGKLNGMTTDQKETAPIPYVSTADSNWDSATTWSPTSVQQIPNSKVNNIKPNDLQTWNIVTTKNNVASTRSTNTTVLGLLVENKKLSISNDQALFVNTYLNINDGAILDLVGQSQLLQPEKSLIGTGTGVIEIDQQGTSNLFSYNYWGSPVSTDGTTYSLSTILHNATNPNSLQTISWTNGTNANYGSTIMSSRWIYAFYNNDHNAYSQWESKGAVGTFNIGLGFTMKGSGGPGTTQNYTFKGRPNNGTIDGNIVTASLDPAQRNQTLVGNPYPSAIDAREFIKDNIPKIANGLSTAHNMGTTESIDGSLYLWKQGTGNNSHYLAAYQGGYATLNLSGGVAATSAPTQIGGIGDANAYTPKYFLPVGQGFFVKSADKVDQKGTKIRFKNSQRFFVKENSGNSEFFRGTSTQSRDSEDIILDDIQRIRLKFTTPEGAMRPLLLAFTPDNAASDALDYGYDALNNDDFPNDMSFIVEDGRYVIQGVGAFDETKKYPLGIFMSTTGTVKVELADLENFDAPIDIFVHDALLDTYTKINAVSFQLQLDAGHYTDRFSIVFQTDQTLGTIDNDFKDIDVKYLQRSDEIYVKTPASIEVRQVYLINIAGQTVKSWNMTNMNFSEEFKIPVKAIAEGSYILKIETGTNSYSKKVIVKF